MNRSKRAFFTNIKSAGDDYENISAKIRKKSLQVKEKLRNIVENIVAKGEIAHLLQMRQNVSINWKGLI